MTDKKLNLLIVARSLWIGGAESVIQHLAETIDRRRFNVSVCYLKERGQIGEALAKSGIDIVGVQDSDKVDYFVFLKLLKVIRSRRIDIVHTHETFGLFVAALCKIAMCLTLRRPGFKVIHTFHFGNYPNTRPEILRMERFGSRFANRLLAVGEVQRGQIRSVFRFRDRSIGTLRNGVMMPTHAGDDSFRARVGAERRFLVGTIATLIEQKGLCDLMQVARRIRDNGHDAKFVICGEGHLRPELEALRHELGLDDDVVLPGWVANAAEAALPSFDVFFQPSLWEAMSMVTLEAMAAGKPVVATRVGEAPHVIEDGVDGLLANPGDVDGMTKALVRLMTDADLRRQMGRAARQKVELHFTVAHMTQAYEQVYLDTAR
jgi:glycosyltransferase involved in cell wall biosynthesis